MPFGFGGVVAGAASCFFAYIGFDGLSSAAEEAKSMSKCKILICKQLFQTRVAAFQ